MTTFDAFNHIHLPICSSTQVQLKEILLNKESLCPTLLTTDNQTKGHGRRGSAWDFYEGSMAFSFCFKPQLGATLIPLYIATVICEFLYKNYNIDLKIKWPNDLLTPDSKKCGGIICELIKTDWVVAGVGINLQKNENYSHLEIPRDPVRLAAELFQFLLESPPKEKTLFKKWNEYCIHLNKEVIIKENSDLNKGIFKEIGPYGQAVFKDKREFFNGSLFIQ